MRAVAAHPDEDDLVALADARRERNDGLLDGERRQCASPTRRQVFPAARRSRRRSAVQKPPDAVAPPAGAGLTRRRPAPNRQRGPAAVEYRSHQAGCQVTIPSPADPESEDSGARPPPP